MNAISGNALCNQITDMKSVRKHFKAPNQLCIIRKNGRVDIPPNLSNFKIGQRVYFHLRKNEVVIAARPQSTFNGRLLSCRIRRGLRTLERYGPRATNCTKRGKS